MKKRILVCFLLLITIVTILPVTAWAAGESSMSITEDGLNLIKRFEGFSPTAMADGGQWSIGYGNACDPADYPNGITEEEASQLLADSIVDFEDYVNNFLNRYGVTVSQNEFDALVSITYNLGPSWIHSSYRFWSMLINGLKNYTDNEIASAIGVWCHVGTQIHTGILQRRITEIRLFLYGDYATSPNFKYLIFDGNGGSVETDVMLYQEGGMYLEFPEVTREGYYFDGWYTAAEGGTRVLETDAVTANDTLYAHWSTTPVNNNNGASPFRDVKTTDWFYPYVTELATEGVISGYDDGTYRPENAVTVGQALKLILLSAGYSEQPSVNWHWASGYAAFAVSQGFATEAEVYNLDAPISRLLMAKIACGALGLTPTSDGAVFADTSDGYVTALFHAGILEGSLDANGNRMYYPSHSLKRSEIAKIVWTLEQN